MNLNLERLFKLAERIDRKNISKKDFYQKKIFEKSPMLVNNNLESNVLKYKVKDYVKDANFADKIIERAIKKAKLSSPVNFEVEKYLDLVKTSDSSRRRYSQRSGMINISELETIEKELMDPVKVFQEYKKLFELSGDHNDLVLLADSIISKEVDCNTILDKIVRQLSYNCSSFGEALRTISICARINEKDILRKMILKSKDFVNDCSNALTMSIIACLHSEDKQIAREYFQLAIEDYYNEKDSCFIASIFYNYFKGDVIVKALIEAKKLELDKRNALNPISIINAKKSELIAPDEAGIESLSSLLKLCAKHPEFSIINNILIEKQLSAFDIPGLELRGYNEWKNIKVNEHKIRVSLDAKPILILADRDIVQGKAQFNKNGDLENKSKFFLLKNIFDVSSTNAYELGYKSPNIVKEYTEDNYRKLIMALKKKFKGSSIDIDGFDEDSVKMLSKFVSRRYLKEDLSGVAMLEFLFIHTLGFESELKADKILLLDYKSMDETFRNVYKTYREIIKLLG